MRAKEIWICIKKCVFIEHKIRIGTFVEIISVHGDIVVFRIINEENMPFICHRETFLMYFEKYYKEKK